MSPLILAIDQGTSSSRCILFTPWGEKIHTTEENCILSYPQPGWVEQDAEDIWQSVYRCCKRLIIQQPDKVADLAGITISNQRETCLVWDRKTGIALTPAISWQDRRTTEYCSQLCQHNPDAEAEIKHRTGLKLTAYFSASKMHYLLKHYQLRSRALTGDIAMGTLDSYLLFKLTHGRSFFSDYTNASRTLLFNINTLNWDEYLLNLFDIPPTCLATVTPNCSEFGHSSYSLFNITLPIVAMAGDQQAALFGQGCFHSGQLKATYGTGCFMMANTGKQILKHTHLLSTLAFSDQHQIHYALEGSIYMAAASLTWCQQQLGFNVSNQQITQICQIIGTHNPVVLIPAFAGLGAPIWSENCQGSLFGLNLQSDQRHIICAAVQAAAFQSQLLITSFEQAFQHALPDFNVDGGMCQNPWFLQFLADICQQDICPSAETQATALGVAMMGYLQLNIYKSVDQIQTTVKHQQTITPNLTKKLSQQLISRWQQAMQATLNWP